ncbi:hypothetical protein [Nostoc sp. 106C]|uniref:hypothetical protein n=1 Tax=Nostoc sp. 106C TaxID=1932667 RepID=UPI00117D525F|nr:hypothetical protein [Nostoc sp. 106C]
MRRETRTRNASCFKPGNPTPVATTEGTSLRVHQSPTAGNPPTLRERLRRTGLDSPQRTGSTFRCVHPHLSAVNSFLL